MNGCSRFGPYQALEDLRLASGDESIDNQFFVEDKAVLGLAAFPAISSSGKYAVIVVAKESVIAPAPLRLASLTADFGLLSTLVGGDGSVPMRVSVLRCTSTEPVVREIFSDLSNSLCRQLRHGTTEQELSDLVLNWAGVFARLRKSTNMDITGLCGELAVISRSEYPDEWISGWRRRVNDVVDFQFTSRNGSVEVKTSVGKERIHSFSYEQLVDRPEKHPIVASVLINFSQGTTMSDVIRSLIDRVSEDRNRVKVWEVLTQTCGNGLEDFLAREIDWISALSNIRFYLSASLPTPMLAGPLPDGVSRLKFTINMRVAEALESDHVEALLGVGQTI